ncbi:MAG: histidine--tRNA ligase [Oscillospiraceae bacterium]|jgi:histidyl-tRNA synthetase|nr:histidine--tRNA ligase [Oscillospiraceae bacterium]
MALLTKAPRGTQDILTKDSYKWKFIETVALETSALFGFKEIRTPTFEHTELFCRSVGDTTDVVQKEMYTFTDKGDRSITLKPEGTAGAVRAALENGLLNDALPLKVSYLTSCFRYEKPQAGRLREFHQFGVEMLGSQSPAADAEVIGLANEIFKVLQLKNLTLEINSIGCPECRAKYHTALKEYFEIKKSELCETCLGRLQTNPMRILDCKSAVCSAIAKEAPIVLDYICEECSEHFDGVKKRLDLMGVEYTVNPRIVRGLDYYTKTVFEFISNEIGAQGTVCGGGRYDGLVEHLGGQKTPGLGFAMGLERLLLLMANQGTELPKPRDCELYIASIGEQASLKASELTAKLRSEGFFIECDTMGRSVKAQMKYADKIGAKMSMVLGDSEIESGKANIKDMESGEIKQIDLDGDLMDVLYETGLERATKELEQKMGDMDLSDLLN